MKEGIEVFRTYLFTVAYNILGEIEEAEDIVQASFEYFLFLPDDHVRNTKSYLTRVVANKSIDRLNELKKQRENYIGPWLPEPFFHHDNSSFEVKDILSFEVLSALEILNPVERAVFVLREAFDFPYSELALICKTTEANCRKILSRARQKVSKPINNPDNSYEHLMPIIQTFLQAVVDNDINALTALLKEDIVLFSDGGGKVAAALHPLHGREVVGKFIMGLRKKKKETNYTVSFVQANGQEGVLLSTPQGPETLFLFSVESGIFTRLFLVRNPDKLIFKNVVTK